jgi:hypothetical protein
VPEALAALLKHVAQKRWAHADWCGTETEAACGEHAALSRVAQAYENLGALAEQTAGMMRSLQQLDAVAHDPAKLDRAQFERWMRKKVRLQRDLAAMLLAHAAQSEHALEQLAGG